MLTLKDAEELNGKEMEVPEKGPSDPANEFAHVRGLELEDLTGEEMARIASVGSREAVARTLAMGGRVSDVRNGVLVWVYADGRTEPIQSVRKEVRG